MAEKEPEPEQVPEEVMREIQQFIEAQKKLKALGRTNDGPECSVPIQITPRRDEN